MDTSISYTDRNSAYFSSDEQKWHRRIRALKAEHPDQVTIEYEPEQNDGMICARIPVEWIKIRPKTERNISDEEKVRLAEQLKNARKNMNSYAKQE